MTARDSRLTKAAETMARHQRDALAVLSGIPISVWEQLSPERREMLVEAQKRALELSLEAILEVHLGKPRRSKSLSPADLALRIGEIRTDALKVTYDYDYLWASVYTKPNHGAGEKTRRSVHGAGGDLSDGLAEHSDPVPRVTRLIESAGDAVCRARDLMKGAENYLAKAANAIDSSAPLTVDPTPITPDRETQAELAVAKEAQSRRRGRSRTWQWRGEVAG